MASHQRKGCSSGTGWLGSPCSPAQAREKLAQVFCEMLHCPKGSASPKPCPGSGGTAESSPGLMCPEESPGSYCPGERAVPVGVMLRGNEGHLASSNGEGGTVPPMEHTVQQLLLLTASLVPQLLLLLQRPACGQQLL